MLNHPNLVKLYDYFSDEKNIYLFLELACDGPLFDSLDESRCFTEESTSIVMREVASGVAHMHKHNMIHRDIKLENIVLCHVRIILVREWPRSVTSGGRCTVPLSSATPYAALLSICPLKYSWACSTTRRSTPGPSELWLMNSALLKTPSGSRPGTSSPRSSLRTSR